MQAQIRFKTYSSRSPTFPSLKNDDLIGYFYFKISLKHDL